jgi:hypothetical protein
VTPMFHKHAVQAGETGKSRVRNVMAASSLSAPLSCGSSKARFRVLADSVTLNEAHVLQRSSNRTTIVKSIARHRGVGFTVPWCVLETGLAHSAAGRRLVRLGECQWPLLHGLQLKIVLISPHSWTAIIAMRA